MVYKIEGNDESRVPSRVSEDWKSKHWAENTFKKLNTILKDTHFYESIDQLGNIVVSNPVILISSLVLVVLLLIPVVLFIIFGIINAIFAVVGFIVVQAAVVLITTGFLICTVFCLLSIIVVSVPSLLCINYIVFRLKNYLKLK